MRLSGKKRNCLSGMKERMEEEQEGDTHPFKHSVLEFSVHIENYKDHTTDVITKIDENPTLVGQARLGRSSQALE